MKGHWEVFTVGNLTRYLLNENDMSEFLFFFQLHRRSFLLFDISSNFISMTKYRNYWKSDNEC